MEEELKASAKSITAVPAALKVTVLTKDLPALVKYLVPLLACDSNVHANAPAKVPILLKFKLP